MVRHVVLIKFREDVTADKIDNLVSGLKALPAQISEIKFYQVARDVLKGANSADVCLISDFDDFESLERYRVHQAHKDLVENLILPFLEKITAADFEL